MSDTPRVRIERRGALTGPKVAELAIGDLHSDAKAALDTVLASPSADAPVAQGGDRPWYRVTVTGKGAPEVRDVHELPASLRKLPQFDL